MDAQNLEEKGPMTNNERQYYEKWQRSVQENQLLTEMVQTFQQKIEELRMKIKTIEEKESTCKEKKETVTKDYYTDEEILAKETEWIRVKNKSKKRKMNFTLSPVKVHQQI